MAIVELSDEESEQLKKRIGEIMLRDYSYLEHLMQDVAGAKPETVVVPSKLKKKRRSS